MGHEFSSGQLHPDTPDDNYQARTVTGDRAGEGPSQAVADQFPGGDGEPWRSLVVAHTGYDSRIAIPGASCLLVAALPLALIAGLVLKIRLSSTRRSPRVYSRLAPLP